MASSENVNNWAQPNTQYDTIACPDSHSSANEGDVSSSCSHEVEQEASSPSWYDGPRVSRAPSESSSLNSSELGMNEPQHWPLQNYAPQCSSEQEAQACETSSNLPFCTSKFGEEEEGNTSQLDCSTNCSQGLSRNLHKQFEKLQKHLEYPIPALGENSGRFAREALKRLDQLQSILQSKRGLSEDLEDPALGLQENFRDSPSSAPSAASFESEVEEQEVARSTPLPSATESFIANKLARSLYPKLSDDRRCILETAALRKQLDFLSSELTETKQIASLIRKEYRSLLSGNRRRVFSQKHSEGMREIEKEVADEEVVCKKAIREIAAQVQAESEQWSRMQDILHHVKDEMEELHQARDIWEERALHAEAQLASFQEAVHEWRVRGETAEKQVATLQTEVKKLRIKVEKVKYRHALEQSRWLDAESQLKYALASLSVDKNSNAGRLHEQTLGCPEKLEKHGNNDDETYEDWLDGVENSWIRDHVETSENNAVNLYKHDHESMNISSRQKSSGKASIELNIKTKKIGQALNKNKRISKCNKTDLPEVGEQRICILKSSTPRFPFGEIRNRESSEAIEDKS